MKTIKNFCLPLLMVSFFMNAGSVLIAQTYEKASYSALAENTFMNNWQVLGPVKIESTGNVPDDNRQKAFFDQDELKNVVVKSGKLPSTIKIGNTDYSWKAAAFANGVIDFNSLFGVSDYSVAYALAEIAMDEPAKILVGIGSDDGVKVFLNGTLVHSNWIARSNNPDDDIVVLDLKKGSNQVLVKVQNMAGEWSFTMRKIGRDILNNQLISSAGAGDLDDVKHLLSNGADVNANSESGLSAYQNAMIHGREKVLAFLKEKGAQTDNPMPSIDKLIEPVFKSVQSGETPGVSVLMSKDGQIIYEKGFGYADIGNHVPVTSDTKFRIGSITKQFTASAILKLQEEGKLSVQDKLSKYIPDFPRGDEVTIHHLLTHTSGIHSYTDRPSFLKYLTVPVTPAALVDTIKSLTYDFNPGDRYLYNNSGFFLLGYIVEKISGKSLGDYLKETFFIPLGMKNTGIYENTRILAHEAYGYANENAHVIKALNWDMTWAGGAGAMYSTARDLYLWNEAVFNGKVLSQASLDAAFTPVTLNNKEKVEYGYGWSFADFRGYKFVAHGGGLHGFLSFLGRQPGQKVTVVVLCNSSQPPAGINPSPNAFTMAEYLLWTDMAKQSSFASDTIVDEEILKNYLGRYDYGQGMILKVTLEGKQLYAQMTGQPIFPIFPASDGEFIWKVVEASIKFLTDETGKVTHAIHHQNGQQLEVKKMAEEARISVDPVIFDSYTGKYDGGNNLIIVVTREGDKMYMQAATLPKYQLIPASATEYFTEEVKARFTFKQDETGKTNELSVNFDGSDIPAKRVTSDK